MTNKSKARHGIRGSYRFKLNPTTRAIRSAFALGLALATSGTALAAAGVCDTSLTPAIYCEGDFTDTITNHPIDMTLYVGKVTGATITPTVAGHSGIFTESL